MVNRDEVRAAWNDRLRGDDDRGAAGGAPAPILPRPAAPPGIAYAPRPPVDEADPPEDGFGFAATGLLAGGTVAAIGWAWGSAPLAALGLVGAAGLGYLGVRFRHAEDRRILRAWKERLFARAEAATYTDPQAQQTARRQIEARIEELRLSYRPQEIAAGLHREYVRILDQANRRLEIDPNFAAILDMYMGTMAAIDSGLARLDDAEYLSRLSERERDDIYAATARNLRQLGAAYIGHKARTRIKDDEGKQP